MLGETSSFTLIDEYIYVEAMVDSYLCVISKDEFESFIEKNPKIALKIINILSSRLKEIYVMSEKITLGDVKQRVLFLLLKLSEIATMVGST